MPPKLSSEERITAELKKLSKVESNKTCCECPERMPGYVNLSHKTFVCTKCAGILRDLQFKIKGISMSKFTQQDLDEMSTGGNAAHNAVYLARWPAKDPLPTGQDGGRMKDHIRLKYIECRWKDRDGGDSSFSRTTPASSSGFGSEDAFADSRPASGGFGGVSIKPAAQAGGSKANGGGAALDLLDLMSAPAAPAHDPFAAGASAHGGATFDAFGSSSGGGGVGGGGGGGFGAFGSPAPSSSSAASFDAGFGAQFPAAGGVRAHGDPFAAPQSGGATFDAFGNGSGAFGQNAFPQPPAGPPANMGGMFGGAPAPAPLQPMGMPFITLSPAAAAANDKPAAPAAGSGGATLPPPPKNFSAFDDLVVQPPAAGNPFEAAPGPGQPPMPGAPGPGYGAAPAPYPQHPPQPGFPGAPQGSQPGQYAPQPGPYGAYPPQPGPYGYPSQPGPYGYPMPPQGYPRPMPGYPPYGAPYPAPQGYPPGAVPGHPHMPPPQGLPGPGPVTGPAPGPGGPIAPPAPQQPKQPELFSDMGMDLGLNMMAKPAPALTQRAQVGPAPSAAPSGPAFAPQQQPQLQQFEQPNPFAQQHQHQQYQPQQQQYQPQQQQAPVPLASPPPPQAPAAPSSNPFDDFF